MTRRQRDELRPVGAVHSIVKGDLEVSAPVRHGEYITPQRVVGPLLGPFVVFGARKVRIAFLLCSARQQHPAFIIVLRERIEPRRPRVAHVLRARELLVAAAVAARCLEVSAEWEQRAAQLHCGTGDAGSRLDHSDERSTEEEVGHTHDRRLFECFGAWQRLHSQLRLQRLNAWVKVLPVVRDAKVDRGTRDRGTHAQSEGAHPVVRIGLVTKKRLVCSATAQADAPLGGHEGGPTGQLGT